MSEYSVEYASAMLMNLCLRREVGSFPSSASLPLFRSSLSLLCPFSHFLALFLSLAAPPVTVAVFDVLVCVCYVPCAI